MVAMEFILLCLVVFFSASADATAGCTAGSGGSCQTLDTDCDGDHTADEWGVCISNGGCTEVPSRGSCPTMLQNGQDTVSAIPRPRNVTLELSSTSPDCFTARVRWEPPASGAIKGFQVESLAGESHTPLEQCACLSSHTTEFTFRGLKYNTSPFLSLNLRVKVRSLPYTSEQDVVTITQPVPASCRDLPYEPCHCIPPRYRSVQNIQFTTTLVSGKPDEMRTHLTWEHPNTPHPFPDPSIYYIQVINLRASIFPIMYFKVEDTLSVTLPPLDSSRSYTITIRPYVRCAGLDLTILNGCGSKTRVEVFYTPPSPSPSVPLAMSSKTSSTSVSVVSCPDLVLETHDHNFGICTAANPATSIAVLVSKSPTIRTPESPTTDSTKSSMVHTQESPTTNSSPTIRMPESLTIDGPTIDGTSSPVVRTQGSPATAISPTNSATKADTTTAVGFIVLAAVVSIIVIVICTIFVIAIPLYIRKTMRQKPKEAVEFSCPFSLKRDLSLPSTSIDIKLHTFPKTFLPAQPLQTAQSHSTEQTAQSHSTESFPSTHPSTETSPTPSTNSSTQLSLIPSAPSSTQPSQTSSTHPSTQTSPTPSTQPSPTPSTQPSPTPSTSHPVLLVYSQDSPEREVRVLQQLLVKDLSQHNIAVTHNSRFRRGSGPEWLAREFRRAVAVLVVCNQQLQQEWNRQGRGSVIAALKHMIHVSVGKPDFSKIAVVLLRDNDAEYVPTPYLEDTRVFIVNKVEDIVYFVKELSPYVMH